MATNKGFTTVKSFRQFFTEAKLPGWDKAIAESKELQAAIELIEQIESLDGEGSSVLLVGGCVRDLLMGKSPHDVDIAGNVGLEKIAERFNVHNIGQSKDFGIIVIPYKRFTYEYAMYRQDIY